MNLKTNPFISVIIATLNRPHYLEQCLSGMLSNNYHRFEVIVVDQGKDNRTKELIDQQFSLSDKIRYFHTDIVGLSNARNVGWEMAKGDIIAFIDDDAIPSSNWLESYAYIFTKIDPAPALAGGKIDPIWEAPKPKWYPKEREFLLAIYDIGDKIKPFPESELPIGANFAVLRQTIENLGGFDERCGFNESREKSMIAGEDSLIGLKVKEAGFPIIYQPEAKVYHHISAKKLKMGYFLRRHYWEGVTHIVLEDLRDNLDTRKLWIIFLWHLKNIFKEGRLFFDNGSATNQTRPSQLMFHMSMIGISIGICMKSLQLMFSKKYWFWNTKNRI